MPTPSSARTVPLPVSRNEQLLMEAVHAVALSVKRSVAAEMRREGLTGPMFWALHSIRAEGSVTVGQLGEACGSTSANASLVSDDLERSGLVARTRSRTDRRVVTLEATAKGRKLEALIWGRITEQLLAPLHGVDSRDVTTAARVLIRLAEAMGPGLVPEGGRP